MSDIDDQDPSTGDDSSDQKENQLPQELIDRKAALDAREPLPTKPDEIVMIGQAQPMYSIKMTWDTGGDVIELEIGGAAFSQEGKLLGVLNAEAPGAFSGNFRVDTDFKMPPPIEVEEGDDPPEPPEPEENGQIMKINLNNLPGEARAVYFWVNAWDKGKMDNVKRVTSTIQNIRTGADECTFVVEENPQGATMIVAGSLYRTDKSNIWELKRQRKVLQYAEWEQAVPWFAEDMKTLPPLKQFTLSSINIQSQLPFQGCGRALNQNQTVNLRMAMTKMQLNRRLVNLQYWGTIFCEKEDYTILVAHDINKAINKRFFYSSGPTFNFCECPPLDDFVREFAPQVEGMFSGKPADRCVFPEKKKKTDDDDDDDDDGGDDDDDSGSPDPNDPKFSLFPDFPDRKLCEFERLSYVVRTIDHNTNLVPKGSYVMNNIANIVANCNFNGLSVEQANDMGSYQLFRSPLHVQTLRKLEGRGMACTMDFLDDLSQPQPVRGLWSLQLDFQRTNVFLRSMYCPGAEFTLEIGPSGRYSNTYHGYGDLNRSLVFMVPALGR